MARHGTCSTCKLILFTCKVKKNLQGAASPLFFLWELPQNLVGLLTYLYLRKLHKIEGIRQEQARLFIETRKLGVSLGWFIFWTRRSNRYSHLVNDCRMHEYGHSLQSRILGPLYLLVVGLPSVMRHLYSVRYASKTGMQWMAYYDSFPENWADKLGGVKSEVNKKAS